jgi:hypothetical protein
VWPGGAMGPARAHGIRRGRSTGQAGAAKAGGVPPDRRSAARSRLQQRGSDRRGKAPGLCSDSHATLAHVLGMVPLQLVHQHEADTRRWEATHVEAQAAMTTLAEQLRQADLKALTQAP